MKVPEVPERAPSGQVAQVEDEAAAIDAEVRDGLKSFPGLEGPSFQGLIEAAMSTIAAGPHEYPLYKALTSLGLETRYAFRIARFLYGRVPSVRGRLALAGLGVSEGIWLHALPCFSLGETPTPEECRRNADHAAADGKRYKLAEGLLVGKHRVWPGHEFGCRCSFKAIFPIGGGTVARVCGEPQASLRRPL